MKQLVFIIRLFSIFLITIISLCITIFIFPLICKKIRLIIIHCWAKINLFVVGLKTEVHGLEDRAYLQPNSMVISNHISWLDVVLLYSLYFVNFIGRIEMKRWLGLNILVKTVGTIFIDRSKKRELININQFVSSKLIEGATIGLFPEGKTSDGRQVLPFKTGLFEAAILAKAKIIPLVILYYKKDGTPAHEVSYEGETTLWQTITNSLMLNGIRAKVIAVPTINAGSFSSREELSNYLFEQVSSKYKKEILCQAPLTSNNKLWI